MITIKPKPWRFSLFASQAVVAGLLCANLTPTWASTQTFKPLETPNPQEQAPPWAARPDALLKTEVADPVGVNNITPANKVASTSKGGNSAMETWYRNRHQQAAKPATAISEIQAAAQQGDRDAQFELGLIYQGGRGVPQDRYRLASQAF
ncbi:sel1 repeat family protein [Candidatus Thiothrix anitrata]|uniref:Sel1 repeat family protein n=1 Tax=Candidatus Thiothrix anitrata TaxID=2823902 RepID=A0ABX7X1R6_9GAMM|nr:sel1 repeat family protein [Candidatus Thiothrix anitrata]QTR49867.1 sel1 repeat family protein [Candidatus Thiothrix anitrata]